MYENKEQKQIALLVCVDTGEFDAQVSIDELEELSYTAGAYVCNDLFYRLLHQYRGTGLLVDFIHVPFLPEQAKNGEPSMALADMARALEALILALEP